MAESKCPDFDLAPLKAYRPEILSGQGPTSEEDAFVLGLAVAYNDIKGMYWFLQQLKTCKPDDTVKVSAELGQWRGMRIQVTRFLLGITHEILRAVSRAEEQGLLRKPDTKRAIRRLNPRFSRAWTELVRSARGRSRDSRFRKYLRVVRNTRVFHYNQPEDFMKGYDECFDVAHRTKFTKSALVSVGNTVEATRFHFADAAVQTAYTKLQDPGGNLFQLSNRFVTNVSHVALRGFIESYLDVKSGKLGT